VIVESVEDPQCWYFGVQWHKEDDDGSDADRMGLFAAFVDEAEQTRQDRAA
jgi:putative glutamine amidotransferase